MSADHIVTCKYGDVRIPDNISFGELILQKMQLFRDRPAFINSKTDETIKYKELERYVRCYASSMAVRGVVKGERMLFYSPNSIWFPVVLYGNACLGLVSATANPHYTPEELRYIIDDCEPTYIVTISRLLPNVKEAITGYNKLKATLLLSGDAPECMSLQSLLSSGHPMYSSSVLINPSEDVYLLPYSSGTTGRSKGVMLTHYNAVANIYQFLTPVFTKTVEANDVCIAFLPFYHSFALGVLLGIAVSNGSTIVCIESFEFKHYLDTILKYKGTFLHLVPSVALMLAKEPLTRQYDLSSVHSCFSAAAPLGEDLTKEFLKATGIPLMRESYGLTETSPVVSAIPIMAPKSGSCGIAIHNTECKVVDIETRKSLGPNQDGELLIRGPQVMKGYWKNTQATADSITSDGWFITGDIGHFDEDGYLTVVDRLKELIKWKGLQVPPADLEHLLLKHADITDAAVIGIPDLEAGELPKAYVVTKPGTRITEQEVIDYVSRHVSPHKRLRGGVQFLDKIPKSSSGKILRRVLRELAKVDHKSKL